METGFIEPLVCKGTSYEDVATPSKEWAQLDQIII